MSTSTLRKTPFGYWEASCSKVGAMACNAPRKPHKPVSLFEAYFARTTPCCEEIDNDGLVLFFGCSERSIPIADGVDVRRLAHILL